MEREEGENVGPSSCSLEKQQNVRKASYDTPFPHPSNVMLRATLPSSASHQQGQGAPGWTSGLETNFFPPGPVSPPDLELPQASKGDTHKN